MSCPTKTIYEDKTFELLTAEKGSIYITCLTKNLLGLSTVTYKVSMCNKIMDAYMSLPILQNQHNSILSHTKNENGYLDFDCVLNYFVSSENKNKSGNRIPEHLVWFTVHFMSLSEETQKQGQEHFWYQWGIS